MKHKKIFLGLAALLFAVAYNRLQSLTKLHVPQHLSNNIAFVEDDIIPDDIYPGMQHIYNLHITTYYFILLHITTYTSHRESNEKNQKILLKY